MLVILTRPFIRSFCATDPLTALDAKGVVAPD